ncbi:MAG: hypothetical protein KF886_23365 [Candidatus Hydrogenedentes bacterium]|nr:hypothetical protein [Candidatus Hydrogenedentota bacterium]
MQTIEGKILARAHRSGPGSAFTPKDFLDLKGDSMRKTAKGKLSEPANDR